MQNTAKNEKEEECSRWKAAEQRKGKSVAGGRALDGQKGIRPSERALDRERGSM